MLDKQVYVTLGQVGNNSLEYARQLFFSLSQAQQRSQV